MVRNVALRLSTKGIDQILRCHARLSLSVHQLIPYVSTAAVAILLLDAEDMVAITDDMYKIRRSDLAGNINLLMNIPEQILPMLNEMQALMREEFDSVDRNLVLLTAFRRMCLTHSEAELRACYGRLQAMLPPRRRQRQGLPLSSD